MDKEKLCFVTLIACSSSARADHKICYGGPEEQYSPASVQLHGQMCLPQSQMWLPLFWIGFQSHGNECVRSPREDWQWLATSLFNKPEVNPSYLMGRVRGCKEILDLSTFHV